jgi:iron(III) ABC transporter, permease
LETDTSRIISDTDLSDTYKKYTHKRILFIIFCIITAVIAIGVSITIGGRDISFTEVYHILYNHLIGVDYPVGSSEWMDDQIVWNLRLPRSIFALIAGAALAVGGAVMQSVMKNPLADPYTTGVSSGACFGVAVALALGIVATSGSQMDQYGVIINAFIFALIPVAIIILLSPRSRSPATLILAGVAVSYLFNALNTIVLISTDSETLASVYQWQIGSLADLSWDDLLLVTLITVAGTICALAVSKKLNLLLLGDDSAKSLGLDANSLRIVCLLILSLMTAAVISYAGVIGFIGLISPHIVRLIIGSDNRYLIPAAAAFGATFLIIADIVSRIVSDINAVPVGIMISFIGAPIFLYLVVKNKRSLW